MDIGDAFFAGGHAALEDIDAVVLEADGSFSVIRRAGTSRSALADVRYGPEAQAERAG
jgi:hypothetical protein